MRVAAVQMTSTADKESNLEIAGRLVRSAVSDGAELVVLPEMFNCLGTGAELRSGAEPFDGPTSDWAAAIAKHQCITLVAGSAIESGDEPSRNYNTCRVYGPTGAEIAHYRKIHLFDVDVPGAEFRESDAVSPGESIVETEVELGSSAVHLGLSICYDLRFPELFRILALRGAAVVTVPAAFTAKTGPAHWEVLLRARAIENQVFVIAAGQCGSSNERLTWHGHSMVIDPWGNVLARASGDGGSEDVVLADLDLRDQERIRSELPSVANRRPSAYEWPD